MILHYGDLIDGNCLVKIINSTKPTEIYNLGAQSHVKVGSLIYIWDFSHKIYRRFPLIWLSILPRWTVLVHYDFLMLFEPVGYPIVFVFTRHPHLNSMEKYKRSLKRKRRLSILEVLMGLRNFLPTGKFGTFEEFLCLKWNFCIWLVFPDFVI